jgi:hypothetical protein
MRRISATFLLFIVFLLPVSANAAIAFDAQSAVVQTSSSVTTTLAHTTSGTNRFLVVSVTVNSGGNSVSAITYNGVGMTQAQVARYHQGTAARLYTYYLVNPALGTNNIVVTYNTAIVDAGVVATSYTGAKQTAQPDASGITESATSDTSISKSLTVVASGSWAYVATLLVNDSGVTINNLSTSGVITTFRNTSAINQIAVADSNGTVGTGSQAMGFVQNTGTNSLTGLVALSIAPAPAVAAPFFLAFWW